MAMRLLPKKEIDKAKAAEKKQEIDEGLKLARRIDNLREVAAQEETSLANFRAKTVEEIHLATTQALEERDAARRERDSLRNEVETLTAELKNLQHEKLIAQELEKHIL